MKEENYRCAVECYTKAIDLDLRNAVYYCNRYLQQQANMISHCYCCVFKLCTCIVVQEFSTSADSGQAELSRRRLWCLVDMMECFNWTRLCCYWIEYLAFALFIYTQLIQSCTSNTTESVFWIEHFAGLQLTVNWEITQRQLVTAREPLGLMLPTAKRMGGWGELRHTASNAVCDIWKAGFNVWCY